MSEDNSMTRRAALGGAALGAGAAALGGRAAMAQGPARKTFVLIHGAWHGGWCWRRVADCWRQGPQGVSRPRSPATATARIC